MEKGVKQGRSSYLLLSMKKDEANRMNVERVYRWQPLVWEPGPNGSGIDPQLVREWAQHSCTSCASTHWSWSGVEAGREGEGRSYHDTMLIRILLIPLLSLCDVLLQLCLDVFQVHHEHLHFSQQCISLWVHCELQVIPFVCKEWGHSHCHIHGIVVGKFGHWE